MIKKLSQLLSGHELWLCKYLQKSWKIKLKWELKQERIPLFTFNSFRLRFVMVGSVNAQSFFFVFVLSKREIVHLLHFVPLTTSCNFHIGSFWLCAFHFFFWKGALECFYVNVQNKLKIELKRKGKTGTRRLVGSTKIKHLKNWRPKKWEKSFFSCFVLLSAKFSPGKFTAQLQRPFWT